MMFKGAEKRAMGSGVFSIFSKVFFSLLLLIANATNPASVTPAIQTSARHNSTAQIKNCTSPAIEEFPADFLSHEQRARGGVVVHIAIAFYLIYTIGIICDEYFVPALDLVCDPDHLNLKRDVAGATFMAVGTSSPEFFANVIGTFITKSDIGIGTIVGSAVFNIFGVIAICGIFTRRQFDLDWYPITRDCTFYGIAIILLYSVLHDEKVQWYESLIMVLCYSIYIGIMIFNSKIEDWAKATQRRIRSKIFPAKQLPSNELTSLGSAVESKNIHIPFGLTEAMEEPAEETPEFAYPWERPEDAGVIGTSIWLLFFPMRLLFFFTIPNILEGPRCHKMFLLTFVMCVAWIGAVCYLATWMITIIGYTFSIPDSVMGLTFLAMGTSFPEVFSSFIVSRSGHGSMAVSNSIGSNTFDILLCLGLPWFIMSIKRGTSEGLWLVTVNSHGLANTVAALLGCLALLYMILLKLRFTLSKKLGLICVMIYILFLTFSILVEMNVFYAVNLPTCPSIF